MTSPFQKKKKSWFCSLRDKTFFDFDGLGRKPFFNQYFFTSWRRLAKPWLEFSSFLKITMRATGNHFFQFTRGSCWFLLWQWHKDGYVSDGEVSGPASDRTIVPVIVNFWPQIDYIALLEAELAGRLCLKVIQSLASWLCCSGRCRSRRRLWRGPSTACATASPCRAVTECWAVRQEHEIMRWGADKKYSLSPWHT